MPKYGSTLKTCLTQPGPIWRGSVSMQWKCDSRGRGEDECSPQGVVLESGLIRAEKNPAIHCGAWHPLHVQSVTLGQQTGHLLTRDIYWLDILHYCRDIYLLDIYCWNIYWQDIYCLLIGYLLTWYLLARYTTLTRYGSPHRADIPCCQGEEGKCDAILRRRMKSTILFQRRELEVPTVDIQRSVYKLPR